MGERKVLNKYFPPDFDPKKVPRLKRDPLKQIGVRMMIPFSMQCNTCGEFMYRGKKFNSLKEDCIGEDYLSIKRFRFYIKCVICSQEITFKTDPENGDYELETGASRNFESWTDKKATEDAHKKEREEEEKSDNMKQLENRTLDSKIELEIADALDEIKAVNRRHETVDTAQVLKAAAARRERGATAAGSAGAGAAASGGSGEFDEDEAMIAKIKFGGGPMVRRLSDGEAEGSDDATAGTRGQKPSTNEWGNPPTTTSKKGKGKAGKHLTGQGVRAEAASSSSIPFKGGVSARGDSSESTPELRGVRLKEGSGTSSTKGDTMEGASRSPSDTERGSAGDGLAPDGGASKGGTGSLLLSGIEAAARREAEKSKAATSGSMGTTVVVKRRKVSDRKDGGAGGDGGNGRKKHKKSKSKSKEKEKKHGSKERSKESSSAGGSLGGLLGSYASSSSGSEGEGKR